MRRLVIGLISVALLGLSAGSPVSALNAKSKPTKTSISRITSRASKVKNKVDITVSFQRSSTHAKAPLLSTQVEVGGALCNVAGKSTKCTLKNLSSGKVFKVRVRSRNKNGFGPWSTTVSYLAKNGSIWPPKVPVSSTPISSSQPLRFNLREAVGLAVKESNTNAGVRKMSAGSNFVAISSSGSTWDAIESGVATVAQLFIAPNDKIYVLFETATMVGQEKCLLVEVNKTDGVPICVERDAEFMFSEVGQSQRAISSATGFRSLVNLFQFDDSGALYYMGIPRSKSSFPGMSYNWNDAEQGTIVRRYLNGNVRDFGLGWLEAGKQNEPGWVPGGATSQIFIRNPIHNYLALPDGRVIIEQGLSLRGLPPVLRDNGGNPACKYTRLDIWDLNGVRQTIPLVFENWSFDDACDAWRASSGIESAPAVVRRGQVNFLQSSSGGLALAGFRETLFEINPDTRTALRKPFLHFPSRNAECDNHGSDSLNYSDIGKFFCSSTSEWRASWRTPSGSLMAVSGWDPIPSSRVNSLRASPFWDQFERNGVEFGSGVLIRIFPQFGVTPIGSDAGSGGIARIETFLPILDSVAISGLDRSGNRRTVLYDTVSNQVTTIIPSSFDLRISKFAYSPTRNRLFFSAVKVVDRKPFVGYVDLSTGEIVLNSISNSLDQLAVFAR